MPFDKSRPNVLTLAPGLDPIALLEAMRQGREKPVFEDATKNEVYNRMSNQMFEVYPRSTNHHPTTQIPLAETAFLCPYCKISNSLNLYYFRMNTNIDHQDAFSELKKSGIEGPTVEIHLSGGPGAPIIKRAEKLDHLIKTHYENVFQLSWTDKRHRQLLYNDLNNLEVTCHGHNRIKGDHLDRQGFQAVSQLMKLARANFGTDYDSNL
jgi:hypothetical protein